MMNLEGLFFSLLDPAHIFHVSHDTLVLVHFIVAGDNMLNKNRYASVVAD